MCVGVCTSRAQTKGHTHTHTTHTHTQHTTQKKEASDEDISLLDTVDAIVRASVRDASEETRVFGYHTLNVYKTIAPTAHEFIVSKFSKAVNKKYVSVIACEVPTTLDEKGDKGEEKEMKGNAVTKV